MNEKVYMVWDTWDGVRSGIADFGGRPHYFHCPFDDQVDEFSEFFDLKPIDSETFKLAIEQWTIYQAWEVKFHTGLETLDTHPDNGGVNEKYDKFELVLKDRIEAAPTTIRVRARFAPKNYHPMFLEGGLQELRVEWG